MGSCPETASSPLTPELVETWVVSVFVAKTNSFFSVASPGKVEIAISVAATNGFSKFITTLNI
jgi:hypothetical protein